MSWGGSWQPGHYYLTIERGEHEVNAGIATRIFGRNMEDEDRIKLERLEEEVRQARIKVARSTTERWTEIADDLVEQGKLLVSASSDLVYVRARGLVFTPGSVSIVDEVRPLSFVVRSDGEIEFFEKYGKETWSAREARHAARKGGKPAAKKAKAA